MNRFLIIGRIILPAVERVEHSSFLSSLFTQSIIGTMLRFIFGIAKAPGAIASY